MRNGYFLETTQEKEKIYKVESSELLKPEFIKKYDFEKYSKSINAALDSIYENYASLADSMKYENKPGEGYELNGSHVSVYSVLLEKTNLKKAASGTIDRCMTTVIRQFIWECFRHTELLAVKN